MYGSTVRNSRERSIRNPKKSQPDLQLRKCDYCGGTFLVSPTSRQIYCTPDSERKKAWARKEALIDAVTEMLWDRGCRARNMRRVVENCVKVEHDAMFAAVQALQYSYLESAKSFVKNTKTGV